MIEEVVSIYFIEESASGYVKIGSARNLAERRKQLQTGAPGQMTTLASITAPRRLECWLHRRFRHLRVRRDGEWFHRGPDIDAVIALARAFRFSADHGSEFTEWENPWDVELMENSLDEECENRDGRRDLPAQDG